MVLQTSGLYKPSHDEIAQVQARTGMDFLQARAHLIGAAWVRQRIEQQQADALRQCLKQQRAAQVAA